MSALGPVSPALVDAGASESAARRADLVLRLAALRGGLAAWTAWMADRARPASGRRGVARPTTDPEALNAAHACLVEELERLGIAVSSEGASAP